MDGRIPPEPGTWKAHAEALRPVLESLLRAGVPLLDVKDEPGDVDPEVELSADDADEALGELADAFAALVAADADEYVTRVLDVWKTPADRREARIVESVHGVLGTTPQAVVARAVTLSVPQTQLLQALIGHALDQDHDSRSMGDDAYDYLDAVFETSEAEMVALAETLGSKP